MSVGSLRVTVLVCCALCVRREGVPAAVWCAVRLKQRSPGIASNNNTMRVTTARSSADLTKPIQSPTRYTPAKDTIMLQIARPQAASSQRTHVARTQGCAACTRSTGGRPRSTCTHIASQPVEVVDATVSKKPPVSCQLTGASASLPIKWKGKCLG